MQDCPIAYLLYMIHRSNIKYIHEWAYKLDALIFRGVSWWENFGFLKSYPDQYNQYTATTAATSKRSMISINQDFTHHRYMDSIMVKWTNTLKSSFPEQNICYSANILKWIFTYENLYNLINISGLFSFMFVSNGPIDNKWVLVQILAWRRTGDKPVSEPILIQFTAAYMY